MVDERSRDAVEVGKDGVVSLLDVALKAIGPLTAATALLFYIGWTRTRVYYEYFGITAGQLSMSLQDYVLRSADVSVGAVLLLALVSSIAIGLDYAIDHLLKRLARRRDYDRWVRWVLAGAGAVIGLAALTTFARLAVTTVYPPLIGAALLAVGALLLLRYGFARGARDRAHRGVLGLTALILTVASFSAATIHSKNLGLAAARYVEANLQILPVVTVHSRGPLDIPGEFVQSNREVAEDQKWNYRYTGARLFTYSNSRWFLITGPGSDNYHPRVVVLRDIESISVSIAAPH